MYKYLHDNLPVTESLFLDDNQLACGLCGTSRQTRSQSNLGLFPRFCRIELTKQSLKYRGLLTWNSIPITIRQNKSHNSFKNVIQKIVQDLVCISSSLP